MICFLKLHMCVCLRNKFQASSITLTCLTPNNKCQQIKEERITTQDHFHNNVKFQDFLR